MPTGNGCIASGLHLLSRAHERGAGSKVQAIDGKGARGVAERSWGSPMGRMRPTRRRAPRTRCPQDPMWLSSESSNRRRRKPKHNSLYRVVRRGSCKRGEPHHWQAVARRRAHQWGTSRVGAYWFVGLRLEHGARGTSCNLAGPTLHRSYKPAANEQRKRKVDAELRQSKEEEANAA